MEQIQPINFHNPNVLTNSSWASVSRVSRDLSASVWHATICDRGKIMVIILYSILINAEFLDSEKTLNVLLCTQGWRPIVCKHQNILIWFIYIPLKTWDTMHLRMTRQHLLTRIALQTRYRMKHFDSVNMSFFVQRTPSLTLQFW